MRVMVSGLTAAGKTTHTQILADDFGINWLGATEVLAEMLEIPLVENESVWGSRYATNIAEARSGDRFDRRLDQELLARMVSAGDVVVDAWAMPWLWKGEAVRVWLASDFPSRTRKCRVSQLPGPIMDADEIEALLQEKDQTTRDRFKRLYGFDLFRDHSDFDVIVDNSALIPSATRECADAGITAFAPILRAAVDWAAGSRSANTRKTLSSAPPDMIVSLPEWSP